MTLPKETPKWQNHFVSEWYAQLEEMYKLSRKCFPELLSIIHKEMVLEDLRASREKTMRLLQYKNK